MTVGGAPVSPLVDTHAHLEDARLRDDLDNVLMRASAAGVLQIVAIGTTADDSAVVLALADDHRGIFAAVGVHPNHASEARKGDWDRVTELAGRPRVVALGETGLDRHWDRTPMAVQKDWFQRHLELAHERDLAVVIHCREAERDIIEQLAGLGRPVRGVLHSFTGTADDARAFLDLGLALSFAGMITFANKALDPLREVAAWVPIDRLLVETDSPYLSPHPHRGQTNEPARVAFTAERLAQLRDMSAAELAAATTANARALFRLPADETLRRP
jgi:TatD DNase family protein